MFSGLEGHFGDAIAAFQYVADVGCDTINYSVGLTVWDLESYPTALPFYERPYEQIAASVRSRGTVLVNSAGNAGLDMDAEHTMVLPTEADGVFGVSATGPIGFAWGDEQDDNEEMWLRGDRLERPTTQPADYTNYGSAVDVSAGGGNYDLAEVLSGNVKASNDLVYSTVNIPTAQGPVPGYGWKAGTSMAAPQVAGAVALARSLRPEASAEEGESLIRETASVPGEGETYHGAGHLDLQALVRVAEQ